MEEEERQKSVNQVADISGQAPLLHDDVPDPEEDDLDDLDGMIQVLFNSCGASNDIVFRYA